MGTKIHKTADVSPDARVCDGTVIWNDAQVREGALIGPNCVIGKGVYIDKDVRIGCNCKIQNYACLYRGVELERGVFIGPHVCFTNDRFPRAVNPDGTLKSDTDWSIRKTRVFEGASIGANSTILPGIGIGAWAMVGAGSTVTKTVLPHCVVVGNPARFTQFVCSCGNKLCVEGNGETKDTVRVLCKSCGFREDLPNPEMWYDKVGCNAPINFLVF